MFNSSHIFLGKQEQIISFVGGVDQGAVDP